MSCSKHEWEAAEDRAGEAGRAMSEHFRDCPRCSALEATCPIGDPLWLTYSKLRSEADGILYPPSRVAGCVLTPKKETSDGS